jgi:spore coat protein U-like protein
MRKIAALCCALSLAACAGTASNPAPTAAAPNVVDEVAKACAYAQPIASAAAFGGSLVPVPGVGAAVSIVAQGVNAGCTPQGQATLALDATSAAWVYQQAANLLKDTKKTG